MTKKIIISALGLCVLIGVHILTNILWLKSEYALDATPIFFVTYFAYAQLVFRKYLKLKK